MPFPDRNVKLCISSVYKKPCTVQDMMLKNKTKIFHFLSNL